MRGSAMVKGEKGNLRPVIFGRFFGTLANSNCPETQRFPTALSVTKHVIEITIADESETSPDPLSYDHLLTKRYRDSV